MPSAKQTAPPLSRAARRARRLLPLAAGAAALLQAIACNRPLDEDRCREVSARLVDLLAASEPATPDGRIQRIKEELKNDPRSLQNVRDSCIGKMTRSQYDCIMSAKKFEEAAACDAR